MEIFKAHSLWSVSTSVAAAASITTGDILKAAGWSNESVFQRFYHNSTKSSNFGLVVLASNSCHPSGELQTHVDMGDGAF